MRSAPLLFVTWALSACAASTPEPRRIPASAWLARFTAAARFQPAGSASYWFADRRATTNGNGAPPPCLTVHGIARESIDATVFVEDHGSYGAPRDRAVARGEATEPIAGAEVWRLGADPEFGAMPAPHWCAIVDDRFVVHATSIDLLREVLERRGDVRFDGFGPLPDLPPDTVDLVLHALGPERSPALAALRGDTRRVVLFARDIETLTRLAAVGFGAEASAESAPARDGTGLFTVELAARAGGDFDTALSAFFGVRRLPATAPAR